MKPAASKNTVLNQICNLISRNLVPKLARKHGVDKKARYFTPWSHVVAMLHSQLADFLGHSENAMRWQVWMALLTYLLLRYIGHLGRWAGSFRRLFTLLRGVLFSQLEIFSVLQSCGTARGSPRMVASPQLAYLPGFEKFLTPG
jgi:hypothetical protein